MPHLKGLLCATLFSLHPSCCWHLFRGSAQTLTPGAVTTQTSSAEKAWQAPRTPDGKPDLQGVWLNNSATPLERPEALAGKPLLTDEEVAELKKRAARLFSETSGSDFPGGDSFFLALLANLDQFRNPNSTTGVESMIEREIENRTSLILDPPDGRLPPLTPETQRRRADGGGRLPSGPEDLDAGLRCITYGVPRLGSRNNYAAGPMGYYLIVQVPGYIVLMTEAIHEARIIPLDDRPHLPETIRLWSGDSRGRWKGPTLVVETTNFSVSADFMGSTENRRVLERFTRTAPDTINYEITISDLTTWTKPWTALIRLKQRDDRLYEYACHEGNSVVMKGILLGARDGENATPSR